MAVDHPSGPIRSTTPRPAAPGPQPQAPKSGRQASGRSAAIEGGSSRRRSRRQQAARPAREPRWRPPGPPGEGGRHVGGGLHDPDHVTLHLRPKTKRRLRRFAMLLAAMMLAMTWVFVFTPRSGDTVRAIRPDPEAPSGEDWAHTIDQALPDQVEGWPRDPALDAHPKPYGTVRLSAYTNPAGGEAVLLLQQRASHQTLTEYEPHSGLAGQQRFGRVSCGRNDRAVQCAVTIKGGLLVAISPTGDQSYADLARWTEAAYDGLH